MNSRRMLPELSIPLAASVSTTLIACTVASNHSASVSACSAARAAWSLPSVGMRIVSYMERTYSRFASQPHKGGSPFPIAASMSQTRDTKDDHHDVPADNRGRDERRRLGRSGQPCGDVGFGDDADGFAGFGDHHGLVVLE